VIPVTRLLRARINERFARAARYPVTIVVAPAGFGKSVALRDFIQTARLDAVRYDVARDDRTMLAFVHGLSEALAALAPSAIAAFPAMQARILSASDPVREVADWLAEHLKRIVCTIVVDDLHYAANDTNTIALLVDLIERTSERIRWIIATRADAGLPVASWIGYGRMDYPIGEDDLRFTADEALATADEEQTGADPAEVEALRELTGGWPIALSIALRTRTHAEDLRAAATGTREMVYRYLAEQVFAGLTRAQQQFLLRTSVFPTFDVEIAEALGATPEFLAELRRSVTFMTTTASTDYRYHDLFRDFLERELRRTGASEWFDAHVTAGRLLEGRRGGDAAALALYTKVGAVDEIVALIERAGFELLERGHGDVVTGALDAIPEERRMQNATVLGIRAMLDANRGRFDVAERGFVAAIERAGESTLRIVLVHRYAIELVRQERDCIELLEPYARDQRLAAELRVPMLGTLATAYVRARRPEDAAVTMQQALSLIETLSDDPRARLYHQAAYVYQFGPDRDRARTYATLAAELATSRGLYEVAARAYSVLYSIVHDDEDDPIATLAVLDKLQESARKGASRQVRIFGIVESYAIEVERGDEVEVERLDRELQNEDAESVARRQEALLASHAFRAAWSGDFRRAYELVAGTAEHQLSEERGALRAAETALFAAAAGMHEEGEASLRYALDALERSTPSRRVVRTHLTAALVELVRGRTSSAHRQIAEAERKLAPEMRRLRVLASAVRAMERVQLEQADPATLAAALERLRAEHFGGVARLIAALPVARIEGPGYAQLTPSEREILQLLAKGASTKDVAAKTGRSPQTVDTHIRSICRKLNCSGRREAIAIATGAGWVTV
jgi:LuxR family transcriptional regulator, maltose regulon positive regulatory protein